MQIKLQEYSHKEEESKQIKKDRENFKAKLDKQSLRNLKKITKNTRRQPGKNTQYKH